MIDGKNRLNTLTEFFEDRLKYKYVYFSQLSQIDKNHFINYDVSYSIVKNLSTREKLELFLKVNTTGKIVSEEHLNKVRSLLDYYLNEGIEK